MANWLRSLARLLLPGKRPARLPHRARRSRMALECLEDRVTPSTVPLAVASYADSAIYEINATTGAPISTLVVPNSQSILQGPAGMTVGPDGNLYISSQGNDSIVEYNLTTQSLSTFIPASVLGPIASSNGDTVFGPAGVTFGPDGDLYVALSGANGTTAPTGPGAVVRFDINNNGGLAYSGQSAIIASAATLNVPGGLIDPTGMAFGVGASNIDTLYVSDSGVGSVVAIPHAIAQTPGTMTTFVAAGSGAVGHTLNYPSGLTWAANGNLEVVDLGATSLQGQILTFKMPTAPASTAITAGSNTVSLPLPSSPALQDTIHVASTAAFPSSGSLFINAINTTVSYTGKTATTFTGVSGGTGILATGETVTATDALAPYVGSFAQPLSRLNLAFPSDAVFTSTGQLLTADLGPSSTNGQGTIDEFAASGAFVKTLVSASAVATTTFTPSQLALNLGNIAPTVSISSNYNVNEGSPVTLHAIGTDAQGFPLTYTWDINGDGAFGQATGANPTLTWAQLVSLGVDYAGTFSVRVIASDGHGLVTMSQPATLTVNYTPVTGPGMVVTSFFDGAVYEFGANGGKLLDTLVAPYSNQSSILTNPAGVTDGPDGNLYISNQVSFPPSGTSANPSGESIVEENLSTNTLTTFIPTSVLAPIAASIGDTQFVPAGVTFGPDGNLYVALNGGYDGNPNVGAYGATPGAIVRFDITDNNGVLTYANSYQVIATTSTVGGSALLEPEGIAFGVTPSDLNNLYVANSGGGYAPGNIVKITDATGTNPTPSIFIKAGAEGLTFPTAVLFEKNGDLVVSDFGGSAVVAAGRIELYGPKGQTLTPLIASLPAQFPSDIALTSTGRVVIANLGANYPPNLLGSVEEVGAGILESSSQFAVVNPGDSGSPSDSGFSPSAIVLNAGNVAPTVSIKGNYSVNEGSSVTLHAVGTDAQGLPLTYSWEINGDDTFGQATGANPTLTWAQLVSLGVDYAGTFKIRVIVSDGHGQTAMSQPMTLTVNYTPVTGPGLVVTSFFDGAIYDFGPNGSPILDTLVAPYSNQSSILTNPAGVTDGPDGNLYISNQVSFPPSGASAVPSGESIVEENLSTNTLTTFIPSSLLGPIAAQIKDSNGVADTQFVPAGITFGPDGNLYVALNGGYDGNPDVGANGATPGAIVRFDMTDNNGVLTYANNYQIIATTSTVGGSDLLEPEGIAFGVTPSDMTNLYVANSGGGLAAGNIVKISDAIGANPTPSIFIKAGAEGLTFPTAVLFEKSGDLVVSDFGGSAVTASGRIELYGPNGQTLSPLLASMPSQFPSDIALTSTGRVVIANLGANYPPNLLGSIEEVGVGVLEGSSQFAIVNPGDSGSPTDSGFSPSALVPNAGTRAPVVNPGTGYTVAEGSPLSLKVQAQDPNGSPLTYSWSVNGNGAFGQATGASPTLSWAQLVALGINQPGTWQVQVMVADADGHVVTSSAVPLTVTYVAPTLKISGPAAVVENKTYTLVLASLPTGADYNLTWTINWGDGSTPQVVTGNPSSVTHVFTKAARIIITATAADNVSTYNSNNLDVDVVV